MELFDFGPKHEKPFTLVFPHIPKTGGTTLLYHFRKQLGDNAILSYGPHNRIVRFFNDKQQLEEMSADNIRDLHVVQGHSVSEDVLPVLLGSPVRLLVVLRHPVSLMRSRFNQRTIGLAGRGRTISSQDFIDSDPENFMSSLLLNKFGALADETATTPLDQIISILRKFNYVYTTENLDAQVGNLTADMQLSGPLERRRVAQSKAVLDITDEEIMARNALDIEVFERANKVLDDRDSHNAFGFDADRQAEVLAALQKNSELSSERVLYGALARALCQDLRAEAALAKIDSGKVPVIGNPMLLRRLIEKRWARMSDDLTPERAKISKHWLESWKTNHI